MLLGSFRVRMVRVAGGQGTGSKITPQHLGPIRDKTEIQWKIWTVKGESGIFIEIPLEDSKGI